MTTRDRLKARRYANAVTLLGNLVWALEEIDRGQLRATPEQRAALAAAADAAKDVALQNLYF